MKVTPQRLSALAAAVCAAFAQSAWSQGSLEEIVVTATRRDTNVQDLPMAVTAISAESLDKQNIENVMDLTAVVPNILLYGGGGGISGTVVTFRGIPNVGTYVDGVWQVSNAGLLQRQFVDLERVEVLRGPQGTLIGRDSTGGSIQIFTKAPAEEFGVSAQLGVGSFDRRDVNLSVDIPLAKNFYSKWTLADYQKDGYVTSVVTGDKTGDLKNEVVRGDFLWTPTDRLRTRLIFSSNESEALTARVQTFINPQVAYDMGWQVGIAEAHDIASLAAGGVGFNCKSTVAGCPGGALDKYESRMHNVPRDLQDLDQTTFQLDYDITDSLAFKYIYGATEMNTQAHTDYAGAEYNFFMNYDVNRLELDSHELQLTGGGSRISWLAGAYTWDQSNSNRGLEWSHSDWTHAAPAGPRQILDFADVMASPTCNTTAQQRGRNFDGVRRADNTIVGPSDGDNGLGAVQDSWVLPCSQAHPLVPFGLYVPAINLSIFNSTDGFNGSDRSSLAEQNGFAYFGEVRFQITDSWDMTVGYRHHDQDNDNWNRDLAAGKASGRTELRPITIGTRFASVDRALNAPIIPSSLTHNSFDKDTYRFATSYKFNDDVMIYLNYSEGFNSGGIATHEDSLGRVVTQYDPETIENLEIGLRADFLDGRLRSNITLFDTDWLDIQATRSVIDRGTLQPITEVTTDNAADGSAQGIELELTYLATQRLTLGLNLGTADTKYFNIKPGAQITENTEFGGSPDRTVDAYAEYGWSFGGGAMLTARFGANYWGRYWRSSIPSFREDAYGGNTQSGDFWTTTARLDFRPSAGNYELSLWGNNLNNAYNINSGFMDSIWQFDFAGVDAPREVGVTLKMRF
ncbi:MAG TPA: TonB-dependent receptor [Gammaproteobacteria bacterium]|nr:TonB-dependent receptor [Gammaproteobacteria bacterium]